MKFDDVLAVQQEVFARVFEYSAMASGSENGENREPFFQSRRAIDAEAHGDRLKMSAEEIALGIGESETALSARNREFELVVYCQDRRLLNSRIIEDVRRRAKGEARVIVVGRVRQQAVWHQSETRPLRIGCSIGHRQVTAGTLGCFVKSDTGRVSVISNNHVLAVTNRATVGDPIVQPGRSDGGIDPTHRIGTLQQFVPIGFGATTRNFIDAALASVLPAVKVETTIYDGPTALGHVGSRPKEIDLGETVIKVGRTTGFTRGRVQAVNVNNLYVAMSSHGNEHLARFDGQIAIEGANGGAFSKPGDSGSLIMAEDFSPYGLLFAGGKTGGSNGQGLTFANPIEAVFTSLNCTIFENEN